MRVSVPPNDDVDEQLPMEAPAVPDIPEHAVDNPKIAIPPPSIKEIRAKSKAELKKAYADYFSKRDMRVIIAGLILIALLIALYMITAFSSANGEKISSFMHLLHSMIMLIAGYIFTKTSQR